jgi:hypothetical protein
MTSAAKMKAEPVPETVKVRANLAALGLRRGQETTTALTPLIQGAINSGVLSRIDDPEPEPQQKRKPKASTGGDGSV